jgi:magnesium chelatase accessory protein
MTAAVDLPPADWPYRDASRLRPRRPHRWHVQVTGQGPDLLLLHGAGASSHTWHRLIPRLPGYRTIALDLPGHGWTRSPRGTARLGDVAKDIAALAGEEGWTPQAVIGHSAGAAVALEMARQRRLEVGRVVAINGALENFKGTAGWLFPMMAKMLALNPLTGFLISQGGRSTAQVRSILASTGTELDDEALSYYARLISRRIHVEGTLAMMAQWSLDELNRGLPEIDADILFLHGAQDGAVNPRVAERAASLLPRADLRVLDGVGHLAHEEAPDLVADAIQRFAGPAPA